MGFLNENRICALPDDLLLRILAFLPTKDAIATSILSKRWRYVWTMLPELEFRDDKDSESVGWFIDKSLQLHKAPRLVMLLVKLGPRSAVDVDVRKWVEKAVKRRVEVLDFNLLWTPDPVRFPTSLYTCDTLVQLILSNKILVDVSYEARLPSLLSLSLIFVLYKNEDSLVKLLSSSPVLKSLMVQRHENDNLTHFTVKVPSLKILFYMSAWRNNDDDDDDEDDDLVGSLIIDSPALTILDLFHYWEDYCLIENMPCLEEAYIGYVTNPDDKFLRSLSSVRYMYLCLSQPMVQCCSAIKFSWLTEFYFCSPNSFDWLEPLVILLQNAPKLKVLIINVEPECLSSSWNKPHSIPECLSSHLEIFWWIEYGGAEVEKQLLTYILANSKCLKTVEISLISTSNLEEKQKELESLPRLSTSSQLLFPTQMEWSHFRI